MEGEVKEAVVSVEASVPGCCSSSSNDGYLYWMYSWDLLIWPSTTWAYKSSLPKWHFIN